MVSVGFQNSPLTTHGFPLWDANGEDDLALCFLPLRLRVDARRADEVELAVDRVEKHAHVPQDEAAEFALRRRGRLEQAFDIRLRLRHGPSALDDLAHHAQLLILAAQLQQRAGANTINVYDILNCDNLVMAKGAVEQITEVYA